METGNVISQEPKEANLSMHSGVLVQMFGRLLTFIRYSCDGISVQHSIQE